MKKMEKIKNIKYLNKSCLLINNDSEDSRDSEDGNDNDDYDDNNSNYKNNESNKNEIANLRCINNRMIDSLNTEFDELLQTFNSNINNIFKSIFEIKGIKGDIEKEINKILDMGCQKKENEYFNIINKHTKFSVNMFKYSILDIFKMEDDYNIINIEATTENEEIINIIILINEEYNIIQNSLYRASNLFYRSFTPGNRRGIPKVIVINISYLNMYNTTENDMNNPHWIFTFKDKNTNEEKKFEDIFNIHIIELEKINEFKIEQIIKLRENDPWVLFLFNPNDTYFTKKTTPKVFTMAREQLLYLQSSDAFQRLHFVRQKRKRDEITRMSYIIKKAKANNKLKRLK